MDIAITGAEVSSLITSEDLPILVDVWAPWCGPCKMLGPIIEKLAEELDGKAKVLKLNADENPEFASTYRVTALPTVLIFKGGELKDTHIGIMPVSKYKESLGL